MSKRRWRDSGLEDLGVSESLLTDLDIVEGINDDLRDVNEAVDVTADNRKAEASLDVDDRVAGIDAAVSTAKEAATGIADTGIADVSIRAADALVPRSAIEIAKDNIVGAGGRKLRRYKRRWKIERLFAWLGDFRRLVVRYERRVENYLGFVKLGCIVILLRYL